MHLGQIVCDLCEIGVRAFFTSLDVVFWSFFGNILLIHCDSIITRSPHGLQIFEFIKILFLYRNLNFPYLQESRLLNVYWYT